MPECVKLLAHSLGRQAHQSEREQQSELSRDLPLPLIFDFGCGQKQRTNDKGDVVDIAICGAGSDSAPYQRLRELENTQVN